MALNQMNLDAAWEDACVAFRQVAGIDLKSERAPTAADIRTLFDSKKDRDAVDNQKIDKVKAVFGKTLTCIDRVGGIAAQGASMVFGSPASIAGNALSFFINAGAAYRQLFDEIDSLMSQIIVVLERFQVYYDSQAVLPPQMIRVANKLLVTVVQICGSCHKTLKKNRLGKFFTLTFFGDDSGVKAHLAQLQTLQGEESQIRGALNLVATQETRQNIQSGFALTNTQLERLSLNVHNLQSESSDRESLRFLREALSIPEKNLPVDEHRKFVEQLTPEACGWLHDDLAYRSWSDVNTQSEVLIIAGNEGCGKSYAVAAILEDLMKRYPQLQEDANPVSIAYFYLNKPASSDESPTMTEVANHLAWQIARNDPLYRKQLVESCKNNISACNPVEFWQRVLLDYHRQGITFFLVVDGVHNLDTPDEQRLLEIVEKVVTGSKKLHSKVLLGSRNTFAKTMASRLPSVATVSIVEKNGNDISRFIGERMREMSSFKNKSEATDTLMKFISDGLSEAVKGSFVYADVLLGDIESVYDEQEARAIVERAKLGETLIDSIKATIDKYNQSLGAKEIEDLNSILPWIIFSAAPATLNLLESVLLLKRGDKPLKPLAKQIEERFGDILVIEYDEDDSEWSPVHLRSDTIQEYLVDLATDARSSAVEGPTDREIRMIQNMIRNICDQALYAELGLDAFFEQKLSKRDSAIMVDPENAQGLIATTCLRILTMKDEYNEAYWAAQLYAANNLLFHLQRLDAENGSSRSEAEAGPLLLQLLRDASTLSLAVGDLRLGDSRVGVWSFHDKLVHELVRLLRSPSVMRKVMVREDDGKAWVMSLRKSSTPEIDILLPTAKVMAQSLLTPIKIVDSLNAFIWLVGFLNKQQRARDQSHPRISSFNIRRGRFKGFPAGLEESQEESTRSVDQLPFSMIIHTFDYAKTLLDGDVSEFDAAHSLATACAACDYQVAAIENFQKCLLLKKDNVDVLAGLAEAYGYRTKRQVKRATEDYTAALDCARRAVDLQERGNDQATKQPVLSMREKFADAIIEWNLALEQYDEVEQLYSQQLEKLANDKGTDNEDSILWVKGQLVLLRCKQKRYSELASWLKTCDSKTLSNLMLQLAYGGGWHYPEEGLHTIKKAFKQLEDLTSLRRVWQDALDHAVKKNDEQRWSFFLSYGTLKYHLADLLFQESINKEESDRAVQMWEEIVIRGESNDFYQGPEYESALRLGPIYIQQAVQAGAGSQKCNDILDKIRALGTRADEAVYDSVLSMTLIRSLVCRYYVALENLAEARTALRPDIEVGIKLLQDDDAGNDHQGFRKLAGAFFDYGDDQNAVAAWCMIAPNNPDTGLDLDVSARVNGIIPQQASLDGAENSEDSISMSRIAQDSQIETIQSESAGTRDVFQQEVAGPLVRFRCSAECDHVWTFADDIWICRSCIDVFLCSKCYSKTHSAGAVLDRCNFLHKFLHIPPWNPASARRIAAGIVLVGDREVPISQWLAEIATAWDIEL